MRPARRLTPWKRQPKAECADKRESQRELFHLQADNQHRECGWTRQQAARQTKEHDLWRRHFVVQEALKSFAKGVIH